MWIVYYADDDSQIILDVVSTYENLVNYFRVFQEQYPTFRQVGPIPNISEEGKFVPILQAYAMQVSIVRMLPRSTPSFEFDRNAFEFD